MVKTGGYTIYATIDPTVQAAVDAVYEDLANVPTTTSAQQLQSAMSSSTTNPAISSAWRAASARKRAP